MTLKEYIRPIRDFIFEKVEKILIHLMGACQFRLSQTSTTFILIERKGRHGKESMAEINFVRSLRNYHQKFHAKNNLRVFYYNNAFWLKDSIIFIFMVIFGNIDRVIYTQRMSHHKFPSQNISRLMKNKKINQIYFWMDSNHSTLWDKMIIPNSNYCDYAILFDNPNKRFIPDNFKSKTFFAFTPYEIDNSIIDLNEKQGVFFSGMVNLESVYGKRRFEYLTFLIANNLKIIGWPKIDEQDYNSYIKKLSTSLISINFSWYHCDDTLNGRSSETLLCKTLLLQSKNRSLKKFLKDGKHYVSFQTKKDLLDKINYFLNNRDEAIEIAQNGFNRYSDIVNNTNFWNFVYSL